MKLKTYELLLEMSVARSAENQRTADLIDRRNKKLFPSRFSFIAAAVIYCEEEVNEQNDPDEQKVSNLEEKEKQIRSFLTTQFDTKGVAREIIEAHEKSKNEKSEAQGKNEKEADLSQKSVSKTKGKRYFFVVNLSKPDEAKAYDYIDNRDKQLFPTRPSYIGHCVQQYCSRPAYVAEKFPKLFNGPFDDPRNSDELLFIRSFIQIYNQVLLDEVKKLSES